MSPENHPRVFSRVPVHIDMEARSGNGQVARGRVRDVSLAGVSMETDDDLPEGAACTIDLVLNGGGAPVDVMLTGHVVRRGADFIAFAIDAIDPSGYDHLTKLILYNSPSARDFEEELETLADRQPPIAPAVEDGS